MSSSAALTFDDEFNSLSLWNGTSGTWDTTAPYVPLDGNGYSLPRNGEQEWYVNSTYAPTASIKPWNVSNGIMTLTAAPAASWVQPEINGYQYTSGAINTSQSFSQTYGYFEMRAELPAGQGLWPAFWLLPENGNWPPEIDAMEMLGNNPGVYYTSVHSGTESDEINGGQANAVANTATGFHTYGVDWEPNTITYYFDGQAVYQTATPSDMNTPMYMIANLAVGGNWAGSADGSTPFPADMQIDFIRAYASLPSWIANGSDPTDVNHTPGVSASAPSGPSPSGPAGGGSSGAGTSISTSDSYYTAANGVTHVVMTGASAQTVVANGSGDTITANDAASTIVGGAGNDTLIAGHGADMLTGGGGADTFSFDVLPWNAGHITDFTAGTDKLDLSSIFAAIGYSGANPVADGYLSFVADGNGNTLVEVNGHNTSSTWPVTITTLDHVSPGSLSPADYGFSSPGAVSSQGTGAGTTVRTPDSYYAATSGVTHVVMTGSSAQTVVANNLGDTVAANNAASTIVGGAGNDTLIAGHGADMLTGGAGADTFQFNAMPWNAGHITDFAPGTDTLNLSGLAKAIGYTGSNPVADGHLSFVADGNGNTIVEVNAQKGPHSMPITITTLDHVSPWSLTASDWHFSA